MLSVIKGDNMGKTIVLNLSHINIRGDVLDDKGNEVTVPIKITEEFFRPAL